MTCRTVAAGPGFTAIVCGGRGIRKSCSRPGCTNWSEFECDYPVTRKGKAGTCDAKLCAGCRVRQPVDGIDFCAAHDRFAKGAVTR